MLSLSVSPEARPVGRQCSRVIPAARMIMFFLYCLALCVRSLTWITGTKAFIGRLRPFQRQNDSDQINATKNIGNYRDIYSLFKGFSLLSFPIPLETNRLLLSFFLPQAKRKLLTITCEANQL